MFWCMAVSWTGRAGGPSTTCSRSTAASAGRVTVPAWRSKPSWYLIATEDHMIPPSAQRAMAQRAGATSVDVAASHVAYMSQPAAVAALIQQARG